MTLELSPDQSITDTILGHECTKQRLLVTAAAYTVLETLRLRLLKIGGYLPSLVPHRHLRLASSHPGAPLWHLLATRERRL